jgi:orotidine-5'-phosphate decarboxylase
MADRPTRMEKIMNADQKYHQRVAAVDSLLCVGLDSQLDRLPARFEGDQFAFNRWIIEETHPYVSAYKLNMGFYEANGLAGWRALKQTVDYLRECYPDILTICDAKRGDINFTSSAYAQAIFDELGFDSVTLNPYMGSDALQPFLERQDKGCIILCRTSNAGAGEIQDLQVDGKPLWQVVAEKVAHEWNQNQNCMLVVGAIYPQELQQVREIVGDMTLLIPGIGAQNGDLEQVLAVGLNRQNAGVILTTSRAVIFDAQPAEAVQRFRSQ